MSRAKVLELLASRAYVETGDFREARLWGYHEHIKALQAEGHVIHSSRVGRRLRYVHIRGPIEEPASEPLAPVLNLFDQPKRAPRGAYDGDWDTAA